MPKDTSQAATIGFESELWRAADPLRCNMDAARHKQVALARTYEIFRFATSRGALLKTYAYLFNKQRAYLTIAG